MRYLHDRGGHPRLVPDPALCGDDEDGVAGSTHQHSRMALAQVGALGLVLFAVASFNERTAWGAAEDVGCCGRVMAGAAMAKVMAAEKAAAVKILAAAAKVVAASAKARLWRRRKIVYRYK